jgi:hypothetical protein
MAKRMNDGVELIKTPAGNGRVGVLVHPFDPNRLEEAKYIMSIGKEVCLSSSVTGQTIRRLHEDEAFQLAQGQFAYILTHETVRIPLDAIGFISINARIKFSGLVNISGFHVNPRHVSSTCVNGNIDQMCTAPKRLVAPIPKSVAIVGHGHDCPMIDDRPLNSQPSIAECRWFSRRRQPLPASPKLFLRGPQLVAHIRIRQIEQ